MTPSTISITKLQSYQISCTLAYRTASAVIQVVWYTKQNNRELGKKTTVDFRHATVL